VPLLLDKSGCVAGREEAHELSNITKAINVAKIDLVVVMKVGIWGNSWFGNRALYEKAHPGCQDELFQSRAKGELAR
jgi:hypothetical protein